MLRPGRRWFSSLWTSPLVGLNGRSLLAMGVLATALFSTGRATAAERSAAVSAVASGRIFTQIVYTTRGGIAQRLDVYLPSGTPPAGGWPVVLAIHGGGWRKFSKEQYGPKVASAMGPAGYAVVAPNYSLSSRFVASWPLNAEQLRDAVWWIGRNAGRYSLDANRIAAMGESAGGHLAAVLGTDPGAATGLPGSPRVRAVVSFYGPTNLLSLSVESPSARPAVRQLLGVEPIFAPEIAQAASPVAQASPGDAPAMLIHGTADWLVPVSQSEALFWALRGSGVDSELILVPGGSHGFGFRVGSLHLQPAVLRFLERSLGPVW
jgi:acetyl esterase/lipase